MTVREEFDALLRPILDLAYRYAVRLAGDRDVGMDLVQDASVDAFRAFSQFERGTNFRAWFLKILTHRYYRSRTAPQAVAFDEVPDLYLYFQAKRLGVSMEGDPAAFVLGKADVETVGRAFDRLPDEYRVVASLHFLGGTTYQECAETLDLPVGTVRSRLHRARKLLQVALWRIAEDRGYVPREGNDEL